MNLNDEKNIHGEKAKGEEVEVNFHPWMSAQPWNRLEMVWRHSISHFLLSEQLILLLLHLQPEPTPLSHLVMPPTPLNDLLTSNLLEDVIHRQTHEIIHDLHHHIIYEVPLPPDEDLLYTRKTRILHHILLPNHTVEGREGQVLAHIPRSDGLVDKKLYDISLLFHTVHHTHLQCRTTTAEDGVIMIHTKVISITLPTAADYRSKKRENKSVI